MPKGLISEVDPWPCAETLGRHKGDNIGTIWEFRYEWGALKGTAIATK